MVLAAREDKTSGSVLRAYYGSNYAASITAHRTAENARKAQRERAKDLIGDALRRATNLDDLYTDE